MIKNWIALILLGILVVACQKAPPLPQGYQGIVELDQRVMSFEVAGRIVDVKVHRGDTVKDGDVLASLDDTMEKLARDARKNEADAARADLALIQAGAKNEDMASLMAQIRGAQANEALSQKSLERTKKLYESNAIPVAELDRAQAEYDRAVAQRQTLEQNLASLRRGARSQEVARAQARVSGADSAVALEDERLARYVVHARGGGNVLDVHAETGEVANVGTPAVTIADLTHPYIDVFVPQGDIAAIKVGTKASLKVDANATPFSGSVERISQTTEFTPRYLFSERERPNLVVRVRVRIEDPQQQLHAGVPGFVTVEK